MQTIERILAPYAEGQTAIFLSGRSLQDLHLDEQSRVRPLLGTLARVAYDRHGMALVRCNLALGVALDTAALNDQTRRQFEDTACAAGLEQVFDTRLADTRLPHQRAMDLLRTLHTAVRSGRGIPPMLVLFDWTEDLMPADQPGHSDALQVAQFACLLAGDFLLRGKGLYLVFSGSENTDPRVMRALTNITLPQPDRGEKVPFANALLTSDLRRSATLEEGLDVEAMANLTAGTPNLGLEQRVLASARTGRAVTHAELVAQKRSDVTRLSEGTLTCLDDARVRGVRLVGRSIATAQRVLMLWAKGLKQGEQSTPVMVCLAGSASTGKTDLAILASMQAQVPAYALQSSKSQWVGETERRSRLQLRVLAELHPAIGFVDEITEAVNLKRGGPNLDSGASASVTANWLNELSDSSREGRTLIIGATNRPWDFDPAMASRTVFVPVVSPLREDYPAILAAILGSLRLDGFEAEQPEVIEAAGIFHEKGLSPRVMRAVLVATRSLTAGRMDAAGLVASARDACEASPVDRLWAEFADLSALRRCSQKSFFPWAGQPDYPFPPHLKNMVKSNDSVGMGDSTIASLDTAALDARLAELEPVLLRHGKC
jgi:hypothetical protein